MIKHRAFIEFWLEPTDNPKFVAKLETEAAPPPEGAIINIEKVDYRVNSVTYSIEYLHMGSNASFRRNVMLVPLKDTRP